MSRGQLLFAKLRFQLHFVLLDLPFTVIQYFLQSLMQCSHEYSMRIREFPLPGPLQEKFFITPSLTQQVSLPLRQQIFDFIPLPPNSAHILFSPIKYF